LTIASAVLLKEKGEILASRIVNMLPLYPQWCSHSALIDFTFSSIPVNALLPGERGKAYY